MSVKAIISKFSARSTTEMREWVPGTLADLDASILFVLARWSGPSLAALEKLMSELAKDPDAPKVLVCDIDGLPADISKDLGPLGGAGETFWIHRGQVVGMLSDYGDQRWSESVASNNEALRRRAEER